MRRKKKLNQELTEARAENERLRQALTTETSERHRLQRRLEGREGSDPSSPSEELAQRARVAQQAEDLTNGERRPHGLVPTAVAAARGITEHARARLSPGEVTMVEEHSYRRTVVMNGPASGANGGNGDDPYAQPTSLDVLQAACLDADRFLSLAGQTTLVRAARHALRFGLRDSEGPLLPAAEQLSLAPGEASIAGPPRRELPAPK